MDIHPQLRALIKEIEAAGYPDQIKVPLEEGRRIMTERADRFYGPPEPVASVEEIMVPGGDGPIPARVYRASDAADLPVLVYFHGGGWVFGSRDSHDRGVRALTNAAGCLSVSVEYRLAPEHPFPAGYEDCWAALEWVAANAAALGGAPDKIMVGGDSAGGNLAAACALDARERGGPDLAAQLLIYPVVDSATDSASYIAYKDAPMLNEERMRFFWDRYVSDPAHLSDWRCAPMRAADLGGLPPALILAAGIDPLCSEGKAYADRLAAAGVETDYQLYPRMTHAFFQIPSRLDDSRAAIDHAGRWMKETLSQA